MDWIALVLCVIITLILAYLSQSKNRQQPSTVPGLRPTSKTDGNIPEIGKAGSLHQFLQKLHKQFGAIASFWYGPTFTVSIANAALFKEHQHAFNRPESLFEQFVDLLGPKSIQYANGADAKARRCLYDKAMTFDACKKYFQIFQEVADDIVESLNSIPKGEHVSIGQYMFKFALKCDLIALYGERVTDENELRDFQRLYEVTWGEMEMRLASPPTPERRTVFEKGKGKLYSKIRQVVDKRRTNPPTHGEELFIDLLVENTDDEERLINDALSYLVGGFHTSGNTLTWGMYFLATHPECQEKIHKEITDVLDGEEVDHTDIGELVYVEELFASPPGPSVRVLVLDSSSWVTHTYMYTRQFIDETLRRAVIAPYAARYLEEDSKLGGFEIPKNTPVIHALGVTLQDETMWENPERFDPDRFSPERSKGRTNLEFVPFGFAGKRVCPGQRFAYTEITIAIVTLIRQFKVEYAGSKDVKGIFGLVTHPSEDIWVTLQPR